MKKKFASFFIFTRRNLKSDEKLSAQKIKERW